MEYVLSHYTLTNEVPVIEGKIIRKWPEGNRNSLQVSGRFELSRVPVQYWESTVSPSTP